MKLKNLMSIFILCLVLMMVFVPVVEAARRYAFTPEEGFGWQSVENFFGYIYNRFVPRTFTFGWFLSYIIIFVMLAYAFNDIIGIFPIFGNTTNRVLSIGFAALLSLTGGINALVVYFYSFIAAFGAFAVGGVVFLMFLAFFLFHFGPTAWIRNALRNRLLESKWKKEVQEAGEQGGVAGKVVAMSAQAAAKYLKGLGQFKKP